MTLVNSLGYVVVKGPIDEWDRYAATVLGMQKIESPAEGRALYRMDDRLYRLMIEEGDGGLVALGMETLTESHLEQCAARLVERGYEASEDESLASERHVRRLIRSTDPNGNGIELYFGQQSSADAFVSPRGVRFVSGDLGLGHAFLFVKDAKATADYYIDTLGFQLSDTIDFSVTEGVFLHCNPRHHSLAFAEWPDAPINLGHLMLEATTLDEVGFGLDRAEEFGDIIVNTLGRHTNDHMTSFYMRTPSGFEIEYGCNGRTVNDGEWAVGHYTAPSSWGHKRLGEAPAGK
ncbi:VOC family protein [Rhodococcus pyridinivorans]|uniref:VOC family protein n=1 Tax=Rhodococcus pyridinivorans TaxID=103816 RepID=UPI001E34763E|nr:VOC family protein [Rhodococcus pyridinivorans]MCD5422696.1 VOC family protein [Rhodococcus pyridinivorans]